MKKHEKIEEYVLTRDQMRHLQELGLDTSDAALSWIRFIRKSRKKKVSKWKVRSTTAEMLNRFNVPDLGHYQGVPTYTLQELQDKLPIEIEVDKGSYILTNKSDEGLGYAMLTYSKGWNDEPYGVLDYHVCFGSNDELKNAYDLLCWVTANGHLKEDMKWKCSSE